MESLHEQDMEWGVCVMTWQRMEGVGQPARAGMIREG